MPKRYAPEVDEAIWSLLCVGKTLPQVTRMLNAGEAGIPAPDPNIPERTVRHKAARLKRQRGRPETAFDPDNAAEAARAIALSALQMLKAQVDALETKSRKTTLGAKDIAALTAIGESALKLEKKLNAEDKTPANGEVSTHPNVATSMPTTTHTQLSRLARARR
jgi:hypothetical protein